MMAELKELKKEQEAFKKVKDQNDQLSKKVKDLEEKQQEEAAPSEELVDSHRVLL